MPKMMIYLREDLYQKVRSIDRKPSHVVAEALKRYFRNQDRKLKKEEQNNG